MEMVKEKKKRIWIYILVAYGITYIMGFLMWYGSSKEIDISVFPIAQMMYPAAGVAFGYLVTRKSHKQMPKWFYLWFVMATAVMIAVSILSVVMPKQKTMLNGVDVSVWTLIANNFLVVAGILFWIFLLTAGKERRRLYGLNGNMWKKSILCVLLFVALYIGRLVLSSFIEGQTDLLWIVLTTPSTWVMMGAILLNFFFSVPAFFGEEYGWRYYLQPLLQEKFGLRGGVILLGVVWGLWHLPVDFFYYTSLDMGIIMAVAQQITCITLGIFFAYAYMKTGNIWVPVILHFLNNNLIAVFSGNYSSDILQNQIISWSDLLPALVINMALYGLFIFAKPFRKKEKEEIKCGE